VVACFLLTIVMVWLINRYFSKHKASMSLRTLEMHAQLTRALIVQVFINDPDNFIVFVLTPASTFPIKIQKKRSIMVIP
jgi:hypothetical protein